MVTNLHRPVCDLLGCAYPIMLAGMGGVARSELVAAVTGAGAFGFLGMVREPSRLIRSEVAALRVRRIEHFGVNLIPAATDPALLEAQISACIDLDVPVIGLFWDVPLKLVERLRAAGVLVVCQVGSRAEAQAVEQAGAHVLIAQGAVFGTALIVTPESFAHDFHKQRLIDAQGGNTVLTDTFHTNWPRGARVRVLANSVTRGEHGDPFSETRTVIGDDAGRPIYLFSTDSPLRSMTGELEAMALYAGAGVGRITDIIGAAERVRAIAAKASSLLDATAVPPSELVELASPACLAHEMDDRYMGFAPRDEFLPALNELLEAERAGARVTLATAKDGGDRALKPLVMAIHRGEARWCGVLTRAIHRL